MLAVNLLTAISRKSLTNDELVHIPAGYYYLVAGQFQLNNDHPPLVKMWAALPMLFIQPNEVKPPEGETLGSFSALKAGEYESDELGHTLHGERTDSEGEERKEQQ